jgi:hypothetical protein
MDMASILEQLDVTFANLRRGVESAYDTRGLELNRSDMRGLLTCGPLVCNGLDFGDVEKPFGGNATLPGCMFISVDKGGHDEAHEAGYFKPDFAFAFKIRKTPWVVAKQRGQAWGFGLAWRSRNGKLLWRHFYAYTENGKVLPAHWLCELPVRVPGGSYTQRTWRTSNWNEERQEAPRVVLSSILNLYTDRQDRWTVAVSKDGQRAKFLIEGTDTALAFADRSLHALAADGKRKRIIHYVKAHTQNRGGRIVQIPEHIRGLREFDWNGYKCFVTAPRFHSFHDLSLTMAAEDMPEEGVPDDYLSLPQLQQKLLAVEDEGNTRRRRAAPRAHVTPRSAAQPTA